MRMQRAAVGALHHHELEELARRDHSVLERLLDLLRDRTREHARLEAVRLGAAQNVVLEAEPLLRA